ncbi:lysozyme [Thalassococcus sp. S3]|uniref:lysozyme n=1 Tax=Thalassococcus sp. S3 TaxID=2017482 RepID=UPI0020C1C262|nr:lysozyme [Thalassococcus sp. S3]
MKLLPNWKAILVRAHSSWAFILSVLALIAPDAIYLIWGMDTSPRLWWGMGLALLIYGIVGRLADQGIDRDTTRSPAWIGLVVLLGFMVIVLHGGVTDIAREHAGEIVAPAEAPSQSHTSSSDAFLDAAVPFIGRWEGLRLEAYQDIVGVWTVCYGETKGVRPGDSYTRAECDAMLAREVLAYRAGLHRFFTDETVSERLPIPRDLAFVSLAYNVGISGASNSTAVRRLNAGNVSGACEALTWWNRAGGRVIRGLVNRRAEERALCLQGLVA